MFHVNQSWCTPWHDWAGLVTLISRAKGTDSWWWVAKPMVINTHSEGAILPLDKQDWGTN
jgi:hypothetical protein